MRTGIYGGSFNPPHLAHLIVAETMRDQFQLDRVIWMPCFIPPHKDPGQLVSPTHRLEMTRLAIEGNPAFEISDIELTRRGTSYTVDTLSTLRDKYPADDFYLIIGGDSLRDFMTWKSPEKIIEQARLLVFERSAEEMAPARAGTLFPDRINFAEAPLISISSRDIRRRAREGKSIRYLVPDVVSQYIVEHRLY